MHFHLMIFWTYLIGHFNLYIKIESFFSSRTKRKLPIRFQGGFNLSQWAVYQIVAIDVRSRREGRDLQKVGFYDPIKKKTYLNVPAILDFIQKGAQPTETVYDILKKAAVLKEFQFNKTKFNWWFKQKIMRL